MLHDQTPDIKKVKRVVAFDSESVDLLLLN